MNTGLWKMGSGLAAARRPGMTSRATIFMLGLRESPRELVEEARQRLVGRFRHLAFVADRCQQFGVLRPQLAQHQLLESHHVRDTDPVEIAAGPSENRYHLFL